MGYLFSPVQVSPDFSKSSTILGGDGVIGEKPDYQTGKGFYKPDVAFKLFVKDAAKMGISPPASASPEDLLEYQTRASRRRDTFFPGDEDEPFVRRILKGTRGTLLGTEI